ncbi:MAG: VWA domain-containing protein [Desulfobacterales bacterium]|nr:VWA domain-containing protein [Desulfobacterales bacterium]
MFRFASPYFLLLYAIIPIYFYYKKKVKTEPSLCVSKSSVFKNTKKSPFPFGLKIAKSIDMLKIVVLLLIITGMARPQFGNRELSVSTQGINIILALDLSETMAAIDFKRQGKIINRLEAVKGVVSNFISKRTGDRIGVVVFGTEAYTQVPLTSDYNTISTIVAKLEIGAAGPNTAIGDAIGISLKRMEDIKSKSNIIILLTDGLSNSGELSPQNATDIAVKRGIKIYTIGVGGKGEAPFLVNDPFFGQRYVYQEVNMDETLLQDIAQKTGGMYFKTEDTQGLNKIYDTIDKLEKTQIKIKTFAEYRELYIYLLLPAFFILCFWIILSNTKFLRIP